ncbi:tubulin--tyrosine ligase [Coemansia javaensis]|uniref:Tubulin--tyrosine ligase n=1 Tax=Coemansia javaensis TaxID=2761396 RepID=A0A9W8LDG7_9FUNG|nr:tubulin--tyrosine ligase [Coemansia javaensis]
MHTEGDTPPAGAAVVVGMDEPYVQEIIVSALEKYRPLVHVCTEQEEKVEAPLVMHWREYERIDWDAVHRSSTVFSSAYCFRKGLIRKAQMAFNIKLYTAKHPESVLCRGVPETWIFELDDIDYLDEALMECYEVEDGMRANEGVDDPRARQQFILKPSLTGRAAGIHVFDTRSRLEELLEAELGSDDEDGDDDDGRGRGDAQQTVSQIREWVIQRYINRPLLLDSHGRRKFHIRTYVLAVGDLRVYAYRHMLALFAPRPYAQAAGDLDDQRAHLTNTCLQAKSDGFDESAAVAPFWGLGMARERLDAVFAQICSILADTFAAVASEPVSFQPWPNCIEQFGFDFLVDEDCRVFLLEANAYPDFKQTGAALKSIVEGFMAASVATAASTFLLRGANVPDEMQAAMQADCADLVEVFVRKDERKW